MSESTPPAPRASRPNIPYGLLDATEGDGLFPWSRVSERMLAAHIYWIGTTRPDGRPHVMPVWGIWLDETFYFSTGANSVNGRNLAANPSLTVHLESGEDVIVLEGRAEEISEPPLIARINDVYGPKYDWDQRMPSFYALRPTVAFAWLCRGGGPASEKDFTGTATRWRFQEG